jgi:tetratricopeptide (TPR) repeat protein
MLQSGSVEGVQPLLEEVIRNSPSLYVYEYEEDGALCVKFWDREEFVHFLLWQKSQGTDRPVRWVPSAYPRAFYYLGVLHVIIDQPERAIEFLDQGQLLEQNNPKFRIEKAHALTQLKRFEEALKLYQEIKTIDRYVPPNALAAACRGRGFVLIEFGNLAAAEVAFKESLKCEPENELALNELGYIADLRSGGTVIGKDGWRRVVGETSQNCAVCGEPFESGKIMEFEGRMVAVCERCISKNTPWWQFWKKGKWPR